MAQISYQYHKKDSIDGTVHTSQSYATLSLSVLFNNLFSFNDICQNDSLDKAVFFEICKIGSYNL